MQERLQERGLGPLLGFYCLCRVAVAAARQHGHRRLRKKQRRGWNAAGNEQRNASRRHFWGTTRGAASASEGGAMNVGFSLCTR